MSMTAEDRIGPTPRQILDAVLHSQDVIAAAIGRLELEMGTVKADVGTLKGDVAVLKTDDPREALGVNTVDQLQEAEAAYAALAAEGRL